MIPGEIRTAPGAAPLQANAGLAEGDRLEIVHFVGGGR